LSSSSWSLHRRFSASPGSSTPVEAQGLRQRLEFAPGATTAAELIAAVAQHVELRDVSVFEPSIEDLVRTIYLR
jgi:ABC-2 type transport system ATP-binding protein